MGAREELFRRVAGAFVDEDRANALIDAYVHELAERIRELSRDGYSAQEIANRLEREAAAA